MWHFSVALLVNRSESHLPVGIGHFLCELGRPFVILIAIGEQVSRRNLFEGMPSNLASKAAKTKNPSWESFLHLGRTLDTRASLNSNTKSMQYN